MPHEFYEDDGPLNIAYQRVFSIEVSQINYDDNGEVDDGGNSTGLQGWRGNNAMPLEGFESFSTISMPMLYRMYSAIYGRVNTNNNNNNNNNLSGEISADL